MQILLVKTAISAKLEALYVLLWARGGKRKKEEGKKEKGERKEREIPN